MGVHCIGDNLLDRSWFDRIDEFTIDEEASIDGNSAFVGGGVELMSESARHSERNRGGRLKKVGFQTSLLFNLHHQLICIEAPGSDPNCKPREAPELRRCAISFKPERSLVIFADLASHVPLNTAKIVEKFRRKRCRPTVQIRDHSLDVCLFFTP